MADGHLNDCKNCKRVTVGTYRNTNVEKIRQYDKQRSMLPCRVNARIEYSKTDNYRTSHEKANKKYALNHKDVLREKLRKDRIMNKGKHRARELVGYAVLTGTLIKPNGCSQCGGSEKIQGHHCDYNKPLEVMWLCVKCHAKWHMTNTAIEPF